MKIEMQEVGTVAVLSPQGALADEDATQFADALMVHLNHPNPRVAISLQNVPYMDSQGLDVLITAADELMDQGNRLKLVAVGSTCREILELTGLSSRFQFFEDSSSAARSFI